jgi:S-adenosylmethionine-dependent methyltransferase
MEPNARFLTAVENWTAGLEGVRNVVRQELVRRQLQEIIGESGLGAGPLQVLDVGCGQGTQALHLARAGHRVTGVDLSADLLADFDRALRQEPTDVRSRVRVVHGPIEDLPSLVAGTFDLVLCHGLLMYFDDIGPPLDALDAVAGPTARLSLLVRNGLAPAMRDGLRGDWAAAVASFDRLDYVNRLGVPAHAHTPDMVDRALAPLGWRSQRWYGVRVFTDQHGNTPPPTDNLVALLTAEEQAGRRDPYRQVAALLHLVYAR